MTAPYLCEIYFNIILMIYIHVLQDVCFPGRGGNVKERNHLEDLGLDGNIY
jgi:hypothetical protein